MADTTIDDDLITIVEAAALIGKATTTVHHAVRTGRLALAYRSPVGGPGNAHLLRRADVLARWPNGGRARIARRKSQRSAVCATCGKTFALPPNRQAIDQSNHRTFCSRACFGEGTRHTKGGLTLRTAAAVLGCTYQNVWSLLRRGTLADLRPETVLAHKRLREEEGR